MSPEPRSPRRRINRKAAVAIQYDRQAMSAPKVVAKGRGVVAERLISMARDNQIPIVEDKLLVEALDQLNVNQEIPAELYQVVAEILVAVYKAESGSKRKGS
ncbi:MAG TPA: EscU/YscU/HrcU family type III secretion system export apparatus switch protein [bacterium]|nr:EscU/YscU/HrcU family type III secretion system export apparatus switch protein [bacterium]